VRRPDYTPLQPLPDLQFEPSETILVKGGSGVCVPMEAEVYGQQAVIRMLNDQMQVIEGEYAILHRQSSSVNSVFTDLRVARAYAIELDETIDFDALYDRWHTRGDLTLREVLEATKKRANHPANKRYVFGHYIFDRE
jgi:hypothetical protein